MRTFSQGRNVCTIVAVKDVMPGQMKSEKKTMKEYLLKPIGHVHSTRTELTDDDWGDQTAEIILSDAFEPAALKGLATFSHAEILFIFHRVPPNKIQKQSRHPRNNPDWPEVGVFAQRNKNRPNRLGSTIVRILSCEGRVLRVSGLDAVDGTPVVDIKPVMMEYLPREPVRQPRWSRELMRYYWEE